MSILAQFACEDKHHAKYFHANRSGDYGSRGLAALWASAVCSAMAGLRFASVPPAFCIRTHSPNKKEGKSLVLQDNLPPAQWIVYTVSALLFDAVKFCQIDTRSCEYHYTDP